MTLITPPSFTNIVFKAGAAAALLSRTENPMTPGSRRLLPPPKQASLRRPKAQGAETLSCVEDRLPSHPSGERVLESRSQPKGSWPRAVGGWDSAFLQSCSGVAGRGAPRPGQSRGSRMELMWHCWAQAQDSGLWPGPTFSSASAFPGLSPASPAPRRCPLDNLVCPGERTRGQEPMCPCRPRQGRVGLGPAISVLGSGRVCCVPLRPSSVPRVRRGRSNGLG
ncbi:uncharacterized protein LOC110346618 isoform X2 [Heterocephalus glaber]|uniref:Uncharacterized protein LOC110346618 isoform X2 n=1 Tax=Heterocephalus glaber TaxID=10181 RepID=A0AAX6S3A8_HETGA|nr:uncharacterized protein LOC110346618 isoform X2 [Heterocephalus glaber]